MTHIARARLDAEPPRGIQGREGRAPRRRSALVIAVAVLALVVVLSGATYAALHSRLLSATTIQVTGAHHETAAQLARATGLSGAPPLVSIDSATTELRIESAFPWIATATVAVNWPHTVSIHVVERRPVAVVVGTHGQRILVDVTGRRLGPATGALTLPRLEFKATSSTGPSSPAQLSGAAQPGLLVAATLPVAFAWQVAVIQVSPLGWVSLHLDTPITFLLGPASDLGAKYTDVASVIARATVHAGDVVDVSVPKAMTVTGP